MRFSEIWHLFWIRKILLASVLTGYEKYRHFFRPVARRSHTRINAAMFIRAMKSTATSSALLLGALTHGSMQPRMENV
jgi:hypothetical protein